MNFITRAQSLINENSESQIDLLRDCMNDGSLDALHAVQMLFEDMYGGITHNTSLKIPPACCLIRWGKEGLRALVEAALKTPSSKNQWISLLVLGCLAEGEMPSVLPILDASMMPTEDLAAYENEIQISKDAAKEYLVKHVLSFATDEELMESVGFIMQTSGLMARESVSRRIFEAAAVRFIAVGEPVLTRFQELIESSGDDESVFQDFLTKHPQIIDPLAVEVWPQPSLWGVREPDFVVRRVDDTYLVVEIETPNKLLVTSAAQMSAHTTHAVAQVLDYTELLARNYDRTSETFPNFRAPDSLVVIGMEGPLADEQKRILLLENSQRNSVSIVGFDWLIDRARATARNFIGHDIRVSNVRLT